MLIGRRAEQQVIDSLVAIAWLAPIWSRTSGRRPLPARGPLGRGARASPEPQASALAVALDLRSGPSADRFAIGAATLGLLTRRAEDGPVAVLVDDAHLLDHLSAAALALATRRLVADRILFVATVRSGEPGVLLQAGLPVLELQGLDVRRPPLCSRVGRPSGPQASMSQTL